MTPKPTDRNTKAEILAAYQELAKEKASLESQIKQLEKLPSKSTEPPSKISQKSEQQQMEDTIALLMKLQLGFGSSVSALSDKLTLEAAKLEALRERVDEEMAQLVQLHHLSEVEDNTLNRLIDEYERSHTEFEEEFLSRQTELEKEFEQAKQAWLKECSVHHLQIRERNETYQKNSKREIERYQYELERERTLEERQYAQIQEERDRELEETQQQQRKVWQEREKAIADREQQFTQCQQKVEEHPKELEATVKRGKDNGRNIAYYQAKVKADLKHKEVEGQKQFYEVRLSSLEESIRARETRIQVLTKQLESALKQVQDLAVKAIEGSANAKSLQAVKDIALEQAKNQSRAK